MGGISLIYAITLHVKSVFRLTAMGQKTETLTVDQNCAQLLRLQQILAKFGIWQLARFSILVMLYWCDALTAPVKD